MVKIIVTSDFHLDWTTAGVSRFEELSCAVHATVSRAIDEYAAAYLFLGDLCDPDSGSCVFRCIELVGRAIFRLRAAKITSVWIAGNHDVIEDGSGQTTLTPLRALDIDHVSANVSKGSVVVVERPSLVMLHDDARSVALYALPYVATSHAYDPDAWLRDKLASCSMPAIVAGHMTEIVGARLGDETTEMPRGRGLPFPASASQKDCVVARLNGHYHRQQVTEGGIHIPGSLARLTFGEETNTPGFFVMEV